MNNSTNLFGPETPGEVAVKSRRPVGGIGIGIIVVDVGFPMVPGNVANASTYDFPVLYRVLREMPYEEIFNPGPKLVDLVVRAARELEDQGVRAIVGACGTFAYFQDEVARAVGVPVFMSVLVQLPLILNGLPRHQKLGVITGSSAPLSAEICAQCGISDSSRMVMNGVAELPEFGCLLRNETRFDSAQLEAELLAQLRQTFERHPDIGAWLVQCSDLPPYSFAIQREFGLPVFDMPRMINWIFQSVVRSPFTGFI